MVPSFTLYYISKQPAVDYLVSDYTDAVWVVPVLIAVSHWYNSHYGPNRYAIAAALLLPSLLLLMLGVMTNEGASKYVQSLFSIDCDILAEKAALQLEWESANAFFKQCLNDTAAQKYSTGKNYTTQFLESNFRITDCSGYQEVYAQHAKPWGYLQKLEENYACTGFCIPGRQLWAKGPTKDSCSVALSTVFKYFVGARSEKVMVMMFLVLILTAVFFVFVGPILKATGYDSV